MTTKIKTKTLTYSFPQIVSKKGVTVVLEGKTYVAPDSHPNFAKILKALKEKKLTAKKLALLFDVPKAVVQFSEGRAAIIDGVVCYAGTPVNNYLGKKIIELMNLGAEFRHLLKFIDRVNANPSKTAVEELYLFLEATDMPITSDGHFLAYKAVREDYKDFYSGTVDWSLGQEVSMPRNRVDEDRNRTCSVGLHFASLGYAKDFGSGDGHIMILKIDPADVVAIPSDYNNEKGRTWRATVVDESSEVFKAPIITKYDDDEANDPDAIKSVTSKKSATFKKGHYA